MSDQKSPAAACVFSSMITTRPPWASGTSICSIAGSNAGLDSSA